jgi:hypothetical protein
MPRTAIQRKHALAAMRTLGPRRCPFYSGIDALLDESELQV